MLPTRVGAVFVPQVPPERLAAAARAADDAGLDELWLWEDCFLQGGIAAAAIALSHSGTLTVGVGVLPAPMRNVALTAMEVATLERAFPGRVRIGVGHGVQDWMAQIGAKVGSPMTYLREYLTCLAGLLRGETVSYSGRYISLNDVALDWPPNPNIEMLAAAMGPKTLELSGELATGTVLTAGTSPDDVRVALQNINIGMGRGDRTGPHSVVVYVAEGTAQSVRRWIDAGADTVVLQPVTPDVDIEAFVSFVGSDVAPLLRHP